MTRVHFLLLKLYPRSYHRCNALKIHEARFAIGHVKMLRNMVNARVVPMKRYQSVEKLM
jgi:hypothetical protein